MINNIRFWYANGGKAVLMKIAYYFAWVYMILKAVACFVFAMIFFTWSMVGIGFVFIFAIPVVVFINLVFIGLIGGEVDYIEQHNTMYRVYRKNKREKEQAAAMANLQQQLQSKTEAPKPTNTWKCPECGYINNASDKECTNCFTPRNRY